MPEHIILIACASDGAVELSVAHIDPTVTPYSAMRVVAVTLPCSYQQCMTGWITPIRSVAYTPCTPSYPACPSLRAPRLRSVRNHTRTSGRAPPSARRSASRTRAPCRLESAPARRRGPATPPAARNGARGTEGSFERRAAVFVCKIGC